MSDRQVVCPKCSLVTTPYVARCHRCGRSLRGGRSTRSIVVFIAFVGVGACVLSAVGLAVWGVTSDEYLRFTLSSSAPLEDVVAAMKHESPEVREDASAALLVRFEGEDAARPALLEALGDPQEEVRSNVKYALLVHELDAVAPALFEGLDSDDVIRRRAAAELLWLFRTDREEVAQELVGALADTDGRVRAFAARGLGGHGFGDSVRDALVEALGDTEPSVCWSAAYALGSWEGEASGSVPSLLALLGHDAKRVRQNSARALGKIKADAQRVVPALAGRLTDPAPAVRSSVVQALGRFGEQSRFVAAVILPLLNDSRSNVRLRAALALQAIGEAKTVEAVKSALRSEGVPTVRAALFAARATLDPASQSDSLSKLHAILVGSDTKGRQRAARCLGRLAVDTERSVAALTLALADGDPWVRAGAAAALGMFGPRAAPAVPDLVAKLSDERNYVVNAVVEALGLIGPAAMPAVAELERITKARDKPQAKLARTALELIQH
jgi:HEAT repeat protein